MGSVLGVWDHDLLLVSFPDKDMSSICSGEFHLQVIYYLWCSEVGWKCKKIINVTKPGEDPRVAWKILQQVSVQLSL